LTCKAPSKTMYGQSMKLSINQVGRRIGWSIPITVVNEEHVKSKAVRFISITLVVIAH